MCVLRYFKSSIFKHAFVDIIHFLNRYITPVSLCHGAAARANVLKKNEELSVVLQVVHQFLNCCL